MKTRFSSILLSLLTIFFIISCAITSGDASDTDSSQEDESFSLDQFFSKETKKTSIAPNNKCSAPLFSEEEYDITDNSVITPENASQIVELFRLDYPIYGEHFAWSPDGRYFAFSTNSAETETGKEDPSIIILDSTDYSVKKIINVDHPQSVLSFSPDGNYLATTGDTLHLWDIKSCEEKEISFGSYGIKALAFSHDGSIIAAGGYDKFIQMWDVSSGNELFKFIGFANDVNDIAFSPDDNFVMGVSIDQSFRVWNTKTGENIKTSKYSSYLSSLDTSPDGSTIAIGGRPRKDSILVLDARTFEQKQSLPETRTTTGLGFSPDSSLLVAIGQGSDSDDTLPSDGWIRLWKTENYQTVYEIGGLSLEYYNPVSFSPDGKLFATVIKTSITNSVLVFYGIPGRTLPSTSLTSEATDPDPNSQNVPNNNDPRLDPTQNPTMSITEIPGVGSHLLGKDVITPQNAKEVMRLGVIKASDRLRIAWSSDGKFFAASDSWGVTEYGIPEFGKIFSYDKNDFYSLQFTADNQKLLTGTLNGEYFRFFTETGELVGEPQVLLENICSMAFSKDMNYWAIGGCEQSLLKLYKKIDGNNYQLYAYTDGSAWVNAATGALVADIYTGNFGYVWNITFSPDGKYLAYAGISKPCIFNIQTLEYSCLSGTSVEFLKSVAFSPDGTTFAAGDNEDLKLYDIQSGRLIRTFEWHFASINGISFSPDGKLIASGDNAGYVHLWDVATGDELNQWVNLDQDDSILDVAFSPDGKTIASGSYGGVIAFWGIP